MGYFQQQTALEGAFDNHRAYFEYRACTNPWGVKHGFTHEIAVLDGTRPAIVKKTVAYVCIDEDEQGKPVVEKWKLKKNWNFNK